ncbi:MULTISPECIES: hypothetical protein [Burkholderia]|uniref:hypothetical protein n=1 Tax=Burkholderia TaxID=32008 RepID=UPI000B7AB6CB|nr:MULTISPECIES: hypothetical protein [Burkholderia]MBY4726015.1 hypothetical protein [Burkholderia contaminans]MCI3971708.1 hypothetical protein [Burkholderia sp. HI4860]MDN7792397.1 hypothetical protein [Burkholderia contaminans]OXJ05969.1 hypothetical protein CFB48_02035 [Burkholderia sp. AU33647]
MATTEPCTIHDRYLAIFKANLLAGTFLIGCAVMVGSPLFLDDSLPWKIAAGVALATSIGQAAAWRVDDGRGRLWLYGVAAVLVSASIYVWTAGISWIFFVSSVPMPSTLRAMCIAVAVTGTLLWVVMTARQVSAVLGKPEFIVQAFRDAGSEIQYSLSAMQRLSTLSNYRGPIARIAQGLVLFAAPAVFLAVRIRAPLPASADLLLFSTVLLTPCSLFFAGLAVKSILLMIVTPRRLERVHGKPVTLTDD